MTGAVRRILGVALITVGVGALAGAGIGLTRDDGNATTPTTTPARNTEADAIAFVTQLADAIDAKDYAFLLDHLDPVVTGTYGVAACDAYVRAAEARPRVTPVGTAGQAAYVWSVDGVSLTVPDAWTVTVEDGSRVPSAVHVGTAAGKPTWFSDCGTPLPAGERTLPDYAKGATR